MENLLRFPFLQKGPKQAIKALNPLAGAGRKVSMKVSPSPYLAVLLVGLLCSFSGQGLLVSQGETFEDGVATSGGGRDQGGVFRYFGRQIGCLVARGCNSDGLAVLAAQNEAAAPGLLISGNR